MLSVTMTILQGQELQAAREFQSKATAREWATMVAFAAQVLLVEEQERSGQTMLVAPVSSELWER